MTNSFPYYFLIFIDIGILYLGRIVAFVLLCSYNPKSANITFRLIDTKRTETQNTRGRT